ncbi:unknown [Prevotella sp. CAG:487]|nr:unknown [Prevotella sp. CAG:487]
MSASAQPIGTDHHMPVYPTDGMAARAYARATRVPSDTTVSTTDIEGRATAR